MKPACCDTSFLFALYSEDAHTERALATVRRIGQPLTLSAINVYELENALRFAARRGLISPAQAFDCVSSFETDVETGRHQLLPSNLAHVFTRAGRLSEQHTILGGHRAFDILHLAAALEMGAEGFLSFDTNQRKLAAKEGLKVVP